MSNSVDPVMNNTINQTDYLKLFMQELTYQDPLKPIDNREFMAQMAQFSALQATKETNDNIAALTAVMDATRSLNLLGKHVKIANSNEEGIVSSIEFVNKLPVANISLNGSLQTRPLGDIIRIWS